ncbi:acid-sensing ion channel 1C [Condylostylus longicornis]|uniref:acid-sensing ion channel 1C n=1 Tax=Condylostylus longicornis TaxID=2530218 RepID=UPI00244E463C|nr:acid-sensing ion channel 1C [Condylostylus longicornis]
MKRKYNFFEIYNKIILILKEYCLNCSIAGFGYIANDRYHFTERIFWLICVIISSVGSYHLIQDYMQDFERQAVSLVIEDLQPREKSIFPSIGICERIKMETNAENAAKVFAEIRKNVKLRDFDDLEVENMEDFVMKLAFPTELHKNIIDSCCYSKDLFCPNSNYSYIMEHIPATCPELFMECKWNKKKFNCCDYFYKMHTSMGKCFLLNSIQTTVQGKKNVLDLRVGLGMDDALMELKLHRGFFVFLLNEEDVPEGSLGFLKVPVESQTLLKLSLANIINDEGVRDIPPAYRRCRFIDENEPDSIFKYYSFTACVSNCFKRAQLNICNCTSYHYVPESFYDPKRPSCDLDGLKCIADNDLWLPTPKRLQPWNERTINCTCLPSCSENEILIIETTVKPATFRGCQVIVSLMNLPYERYRRQTVRGKLDIVVSIGGILGLFMGASIISGIEFIYYMITGFYQHFIK